MRICVEKNHSKYIYFFEKNRKVWKEINSCLCSLKLLLSCKIAFYTHENRQALWIFHKNVSDNRKMHSMMKFQRKCNAIESQSSVRWPFILTFSSSKARILVPRSTNSILFLLIPWLCVSILQLTYSIC